MPELKKNSIHTITIDRYASDGQGIGRLDGMAVFVRGALRGETCRISLMKVGKSCAWARVVKILEKSPARIPSDCPHFPICGGCTLRHMTYEEELFLKRQRIDDALQRIGGLDLSVSQMYGAKDTQRYRNKAAFPVSQDHKTGVKVGFYRGRSHEVIDVGSCLLQSDIADKAGRVVRKWMHKYAVPAYDERTGEGLIRHVFVRTNRKRQSLICVVANAKALPFEKELAKALTAACPKAVGVVLNVNTRKTNVILGRGYRVLWGRDTLEDRLCGLTFQLSIPSFFQVNRDQAEVLYNCALEFAGLTGQETVVDLYCGTGTISLVMAQQAKHVIGAEIVPPAIEDAWENARKNGVTNVEFICADASKAAADLEQRGIRPDVVCVDPPRKGLAPDVIDSICAMAPNRVVYVSCDPATLARDLKRFTQLGYRAEQAVGVDLFCRTSHVETVVLLSKGEVDSKKIRVEFSLEDMDMSEFQDGATYTQIKDYVLEHSGLKVSNLYISQIKRKCGIEVGKNYNLPKSEDSRQPLCPPEKEKAIREAFKYFGMI